MIFRIDREYILSGTCLPDKRIVKHQVVDLCSHILDQYILTTTIFVVLVCYMRETEFLEHRYQLPQFLCREHGDIDFIYIFSYRHIHDFLHETLTTSGMTVFIVHLEGTHLQAFLGRKRWGKVGKFLFLYLQIKKVFQLVIYIIAISCGSCCSLLVIPFIKLRIAGSQ